MKAVSKKSVLKVLVLIPIFFLIELGLGYFYVLATDGMTLARAAELFVAHLKNVKILALMVVATIVLTGCTFLPQKFWETLFKFRYPIAGALFVLCVILGINGSAFGIWHVYMGSDQLGNILGFSRPIRADEWSVFTSLTYTQTLGPDKFQYFNDVFRATDTDMFLLYGQPVWCLGTIFRPFFWGYLLLPVNQGIAWYWSGRLIALFLTSLEFGMLLTGNKKRLSVAYSGLLTFSGLVQWWFSTNGLVEMLIYAQLSILLFRLYLTKRGWIRSLYSAGILMCAGGFILTIYPASMIPIFYIILGMAAWVLVENWKKIQLSKKDVIILAAEVLVFSGVMLYVMYRSRDAVSSLLNTAYPGKRVSNGGGGLQLIASELEFIWGSCTSVLANDGMSVCDHAGIVAFFPACYILPVVAMIRNKKKDLCALILLVISVLFGWFTVLGFNDFFAKITFFSKSVFVRVYSIMTLANLMLLFRSFALIKKQIGIKLSVLLGLGSTVILSVMYALVHYRFERWGFFAASVGLFAIAMVLLFLAPKREKVQTVFLGVLVVISIMTGGIVNPVRRGITDVTESPFLQHIREIDQGEGVWVYLGSQGAQENIVTLAGAKCINATNLYPNMELWHKYDPDGEYEEIYNRYAHISALLKEEGEPEFTLLTPDVFQVVMTVSDYEKGGVTHFYSLAEQPILLEHGYEMIWNEVGYYIYSK